VTSEKPVVRDFIVPIGSYPHIKETQTISNAVQTLLSFAGDKNGRIRYRGMLVVNENDNLVGRLTLQTILRALDKRMADIPESYEGKGGEYQDLAILWEDSFFSKCSEKRDTLISNCMMPIQHIVKGRDPLLKALSIMLHSNEVVLPVVEDGAVVGVIRLEEIFMAICGVCRL